MHRLMVALFAALVLSTSSSEAANYDPDLRWRTLVTEHFRIHFHQGLERIADDLSVQSEAIYETMEEELAWSLRMKVDVVLVDRTDQANGFAGAVPYNAITIYVTAPQEDGTLSQYEDWTEAIFTHELTHVLHIETHSGIVAAARAVVGRIASTNDVSPPWMIEGLATFQETRHTAGGRGRSPYVDMIERTAVVEDAFPPLGNLDGIQLAFPSGNLRYLFGEDFIRYVMEHTGENVWTRWTHAYGRHIPWILPTKKVFGRKLQGLYRDWRADTFRRYLAQVDQLSAEGVREGVRLSKDEASCTAPSFAPVGDRLVWSCYDLKTGNSLWLARSDGSAVERLEQDVGAKNFTWRGDGKAFVYAATHIVNRFNTWSDIYLYDLEARRVRALTRGARARDPDFSPDGQQLVMVTNRAQNTQIEVLTVDQQRTALTTNTEHDQHATPRFAPSGDVLAVSIWRQGRRDLWLMAPDGTLLRRLTDDAANDRDPAWSPDGAWLYFVSERSGIPNVYAIEMATERLFQVTNVRTGAARPSISADGRRLAYQQYSQDGWEVRLMHLEPSHFLDRGALPASMFQSAPLTALATSAPAASAAPQPALAAWSWGDTVDVQGPASLSPRARTAAVGRPQDASGIDTFEQVQVEDAFGEARDYPFRAKVKRYDPAPSLLPRYWYPSFSLLPLLPGPPRNAVSEAFRTLPSNFQLGGFSFSASTGASDPVGHFAYRLFANYRSDIHSAGGGGSFTLNRWLPVFTVGASTSPRPYTYLVTGPWVPVDDEGEPRFSSGDLRSVFMRQVEGFASLSYPFTARSSIYASYSFAWRDLAEELEPTAYLPSLALRGTIGNLTLGYGYAWGQQSAASIAPEDARAVSVSATLTGPFLGTFAHELDGTKTAVTQLLVSGDWREYLVNPLAPNHVFELHAGAGLALGSAERFLGNFQLGGTTLGGSRRIRGYPFGADRGDSYWVVGASYHLPIWRMDRGFGTVPLFFRYLAAEVFAEAGNAFSNPTSFVDAFDDTLVGLGVELQLQLFVLWGGTIDLRVGYGVGLTQEGYYFDDPRSVYVLFNANL